MDITSASQQFAVAEQKQLAYGRKQQLLSMNDAKLGAFSISSAATPMPLLDKLQQKSGEIQRSGLAFTDDAKPVLVQQIDLVV